MWCIFIRGSFQGIDSSQKQWKSMKVTLSNLCHGQLDWFLKTNKNSASLSIVWESLKAYIQYIRGTIISYSSWKKKSYQSNLNSIALNLKAFERQHSQSQSQAIFDQLIAKQVEYNAITTQEMENTMAQLKQHDYERVDKAGKLLAWQVIREDVTRCIPAIKQPDRGKLIHNPLLINQAFLDFYTPLSFWED